MWLDQCGSVTIFETNATVHFANEKPRRRWCSRGMAKRLALWSYSAAIAALRLATLAMVARLTPIDFWIDVQLAPPRN